MNRRPRYIHGTGYTQECDLRSSRNPTPPPDRLHWGIPLAILAFAALAAALLWRYS